MRITVVMLALVFLLLACATVPCYAMETEAEAAFGSDELQAAVEEEVAGWLDVILSITPEEWQGYVSETIVPWILLAVSAITTILAAIAPLLKKIKETSAIFDGASEQLADATKKSKETRLAAEAMRDEAKDVCEKLRGEINELKAENADMAKMLAEIREIVGIAFGNMDELIVKGFARQIEKVGAEHEEDKTDQA